MHSLIVRLFEKGLDPALVGLETADRLEMAQATGNHAGNTSNRLEEDEADEPLALSQGLAGRDGSCGMFGVDLLLRAHTSDEIHPESASADNLPGNPITKSPGLTMAGNHVQENILIPTLVRPRERQSSKRISIPNLLRRSRRSTGAGSRNDRRYRPGGNGDSGLLGDFACRDGARMTESSVADKRRGSEEG